MTRTRQPKKNPFPKKVYIYSEDTIGYHFRQFRYLKVFTKNKRRLRKKNLLKEILETKKRTNIINSNTQVYHQK